MPTVVPLYKRKQRRSAAAGVTPASTTQSTATCSPSRPSSPLFHGAGRHNDPNSGACSPFTQTRSSSRALAAGHNNISSSSGDSSDSDSEHQEDDCHLCHKKVHYFPETLTCGHLYHSDCYWRWIRVRSNLPEEKSICPSCGFLPTPPPSPTNSPGVSYRFADMGSCGRKAGRRQRKYSSSSDSSLTSSSSSSNSSSSSSDSDIFFL